MQTRLQILSSFSHAYRVRYLWQRFIFQGAESWCVCVCLLAEGYNQYKMCWTVPRRISSRSWSSLKLWSWRDIWDDDDDGKSWKMGSEPLSSKYSVSHVYSQHRGSVLAGFQLDFDYDPDLKKKKKPPANLNLTLRKYFPFTNDCTKTELWQSLEREKKIFLAIMFWEIIISH